MSRFKQIGTPKKYEQLEETKKDVELANSEPPHTPVQPPLPIFRLILLSLPFIGIQFCWAIQSGYSTSTFLQLGMPKTVVSYAWLAGPISGIIVQPLVGEYSDKSTSRWGRRRPYIVVGAVLVIISLLVFGNSEQVSTTGGGLGLGLAVTSFWVHDMAINAIQGPARSLLPDIVPSEQLYLGNALIALMTGLGSLAGNYLGSVKLDNIFTISSSQVQLLYTIGAIVVVLTVFTGVFTTKETPLGHKRVTEETDSLVTGTHNNAILTITPTTDVKSPSPQTTPTNNSFSIGDDEKIISSTNDEMAISNAVPTTQSGYGRDNPILRVFTYLLHFPKSIRPIFAIQVFTWFGWFSLYIYGTVWVASNVYHGVADSGVKEEQDKFDAGIRTANLGLALQSVVAIVIAPLFPALIQILGLKWVYLLGQLVFAGCLVSSLFISTPVWAVVMLALLGIPWTCATTIPWSLTILALEADQLHRTGLLMATMNLSICFPQIVVSFVGSGLLVAWGSYGYAGVLATGGLFATIGAALIVIFIK